MSLESAITRMRERHGLTPMTPPGQDEVNGKTFADQTIDPFDPVDPEKSVTQSFDLEAKGWSASNEDSGQVQNAWFIQASGRTFPMIHLGGMTRAQAEEAVRARWPDAVIFAEEPRAGGVIQQGRGKIAHIPSQSL